MHTKKYGRRRGVQRYCCLSCGRVFQSDRRLKQRSQKLWREYVWGKQSLNALSRATGKSHIWVRKQLDSVAREERGVVPEPVVILADTTFWGRKYGVTVFRSPTLKQNLWWHEVESERVATYHYGRKILEDQGWTFTAAVVDGRRGLASVFRDIPVQICQFHQMKQVTKYLTRRPDTVAGQELRRIMLSLPRTTEEIFTSALDVWHGTWGNWIEEKTRVLGCNRWHYTHKNVRGAYRSLKQNLPHLFTYQKYTERAIPNTTNCLDGSFSQLKAKLGIHRGARRDRRYKIISEILAGERE